MRVTQVTTVSPVALTDVERAIAVIVLAFGTDPMARWIYPDPRQYLAIFPALVRAFGGRAFAEGTAREVNRFAGVALWLAPGVEPDYAALEATLPEGREAEIAPVFEEMARYHPRTAHWYLPLIGVDPVHQRKGCGAALLRETLHRCDVDHLPAYLEASSADNVRLYQRHGFEVQSTIQVPSSPPLFPMLRSPLKRGDAAPRLSSP